MAPRRGPAGRPPPRERPGKPALGQHDLADPQVVARLVDAAGVRPGESALDLGAGMGAITLALAAAVGPRGRCVAVELAPHRARVLRARCPAWVEVVEGDAMALPLAPADVVVANPPFAIAAPLVRRLLEAGVGRVVLVVPAELAERLTAAVASERYGRLTVQVRLRAQVRRCFAVPRRAFHPAPDVPCAALRLDRHAAGSPQALDLVGVDAATLDAVLEAAFASKQRTLRHGLAPLSAKLGLPSGTITDALRSGDWEGRTPGELAPHDYLALARALRPR